MNAKSLVIWGASGHAMVVADIIRLCGEYKIVGFLDDSLARQGSEFCGARILGGREQLDALRDGGVTNIILAFGNCEARLGLSAVVRQKGFDLAKAVHPSAVVAADVEMRPGTMVCAGAVINPGTRIGENVIINTSASVDHECFIGDAAHIGPGARLGGRVTVGSAAWIGIGVTIRDRVAVGAGALIGAGAVVVSDVPAGVVAYGVPAKVRKLVKVYDER